MLSFERFSTEKAISTVDLRNFFLEKILLVCLIGGSVGKYALLNGDDLSIFFKSPEMI